MPGGRMGKGRESFSGNRPRVYGRRFAPQTGVGCGCRPTGPGRARPLDWRSPVTSCGQLFISCPAGCLARCRASALWHVAGATAHAAVIGCH